MTDHDDKLSLHRELAREEPPAALDSAILAASRRAVAKPSGSRRWAMPVSIAAVLVLAFGVTLQMQREQPGVEYSEPAARRAAPSAPASAPEATTRAAPAPPRMEKAPAPPERKIVAAKPPALAKSEPIPKSESFVVQDKLAPSPEPRAFQQEPAQSPAASPPAAADSLSAPAAARSPAAPLPAKPLGAPAVSGRVAAENPTGALERPAAAQAIAPRAKLESADPAREASAPASMPATEPDRELERIARLRTTGRHAEADKALEEFRRKYPGFRIPEAMWERVKPR